MNREGAFLVTGATGFLGAYITAELLRRGHHVIALVRPRYGRSPEQRMRTILDYFTLDPQIRFQVVEAYLERPGLGLEKSFAAKLKSSGYQVFHCAADTSFAARKSRQIEAANIQGLANVFLAARGCSHFHHMSTAYVAGKRRGICLEKLEEQEDFHNPYERTKHAAEQLITELCAAAGTRLSVYRPSVVYGDSRTGRSLGFTALYYPVKTLLFLKDTLTRDIEKNRGKRASRLGARLLADGKIEMPICFPGGEGGLNLIPVDYLVRAVMALMDAGTEGIHHIVNTRLSGVERILDFIRQAYAIVGLTICKEKSTVRNSALQQLMDNYMESYYPYFRDRRQFDDSRGAPVLARAGIQCPQLDLATFKRCMDYAIRTGWGKGGRQSKGSLARPGRTIPPW